jgi:hypothetical protein
MPAKAKAAVLNKDDYTMEHVEEFRKLQTDEELKEMSAKQLVAVMVKMQWKPPKKVKKSVKRDATQQELLELAKTADLKKLGKNEMAVLCLAYGVVMTCKEGKQTTSYNKKEAAITVGRIMQQQHKVLRTLANLGAEHEEEQDEEEDEAESDGNQGGTEEGEEEEEKEDDPPTEPEPVQNIITVRRSNPLGPDETNEFEVEGDWTIKDLKRSIKKLKGIEPGDYTLYYKGKALLFEEKVSEYIGCVVLIGAKVKGGASPEPVMRPFTNHGNLADVMPRSTVIYGNAAEHVNMRSGGYNVDSLAKANTAVLLCIARVLSVEVPVKWDQRRSTWMKPHLYTLAQSIIMKVRELNDAIDHGYKLVLTAPAGTPQTQQQAGDVNTAAASSSSQQEQANEPEAVDEDDDDKADGDED